MRGIPKAVSALSAGLGMELMGSQQSKKLRSNDGFGMGQNLGTLKLDGYPKKKLRQHRPQIAKGIFKVSKN